MISLINEYLSFFDDSPLLYTLAALSLLVAVSCFLNFVVKKILLRLVHRALRLTSIYDVGDNLLEKFIATKEKVHLIDRYANDYISSSDIDCIHKIQDIAKEIIEDF